MASLSQEAIRLLTCDLKRLQLAKMMLYTSALLNDSSEPVRARTAMMHFRPAVFGVLTRPGPLACAWAWCDTAPTVVPHPVAGNARYANAGFVGSSPLDTCSKEADAVVLVVRGGVGKVHSMCVLEIEEGRPGELARRHGRRGRRHDESEEEGG